MPFPGAGLRRMFALERQLIQRGWKKHWSLLTGPLWPGRSFKRFLMTKFRFWKLYCLNRFHYTQYFVYTDCLFLISIASYPEFTNFRMCLSDSLTCLMRIFFPSKRFPSVVVTNSPSSFILSKNKGGLKVNILSWEFDLGSSRKILSLFYAL